MSGSLFARGPSDTSRALVVLAHGFLGGRVQLVPLAARLSRHYDVLNFGYRSRAHPLSYHSAYLIDTIANRLSKRKQRVHFVTHSFGGVVLHHAFSKGLAEVLEEGGSRCVLIAPPLRGARFARAFQRENIAGPEWVKNAVHRVACGVMGGESGRELMMGDEGWFDKEVGVIPDDVEVLVVAGEYGSWNPLIGEVSDGVVGVGETGMRRRHYRLRVEGTHNFLLYMPRVQAGVLDFLGGGEVGELVREWDPEGGGTFG